MAGNDDTLRKAVSPRRSLPMPGGKYTTTNLTLRRYTLKFIEDGDTAYFELHKTHKGDHWFKKREAVSIAAFIVRCMTKDNKGRADEQTL